MAKTPQGRRVVSPAGLQPFPRGSWPYPLAWSVCTAIAGVQGGKGLHVTLGCVMGRVAFRGSHLYCPLLQVWRILLPGASLSFPSLCLPPPPFIITIWVLLLGTQPSRCCHNWQYCIGT